MEKIWQVAPKKYDDMINQLLYNRGVIKNSVDQKKIDLFFKPDFLKGLNDPFLLPDIDKAVKRITEAITKKEKIGIFADYDADGIPGAAFLYRSLKKLGTTPEVYIPNREQGYGLSIDGIKFLQAKKCSLIITIDLGIKSLKEAEFCKKEKIDLIITDHHLPDEKLPNALAVINPKIKESKYPYPELSGGGVAFKLVQALSKNYPEVLDENFLKWNIDLIGITTIADVVPLTEENRILSYFGLIVLKKTLNLGLKKLYLESGIEKDKIKSHTVAFQIAPRINAPGRMDHATKSFELLVTEDDAEAEELAQKLEAKNGERQKSMEKVFLEAKQQIEKNNLYKNKILIVSGDWPKGVIGPVASQIVEEFSRPAILFALGSAYTGSARSVSGINIIDLLSKVKKYLTRFGGHAGAAGLSVKLADFKKFKVAIEKVAEEINDKLLIPKIKIDMETGFQPINYELAKKIEQFEPFGLKNPKPIFLSKKIKITGSRRVGKEEKHLSLYLSDGEKELKGIYFSCDEISSEEKVVDRTCDMVYNISVDEWNGRENAQINVIDLRFK